MCCFFFSSRRRHTRSKRDWSSDVCSSDLILSENGSVTGGQILYKGEDITKWDEKKMQTFRGRCCSIIFQDPMTSLNPVYTIGNQLEEAILLHTQRNKQEARARAIEMLNLVGI